MRILVFTRSEWDNVRAFGNTLSNFFEGDEWKSDSFSNIYTRSAMPQNRVCYDYYRFTIPELFKKFLKPEQIGKHFKTDNDDFQADDRRVEKDTQNEKKLIEFVHSIAAEPIYIISEAVCRKKDWENERFVSYLQELQPDIFFSYLGDDGLVKPMIECVKKYTNAKIVLFAQDDVYGKILRQSKLRRKPAIEGFEWSVRHADKLYGASTVLCEEYGKKFGVPFQPLYKGCQFDDLAEDVNTPLRIAYAGNLYYGRDDVLSALGEALEKINSDGQRAKLEIYTGATVTQELKDKLNKPGSSEIMGSRPYEEIRRILHDADVVLHVESFDQEQIDYVHYSFSTKIIDCLQSGNVSLAIGPAGIASIEYMRQIPGVWVINDLSDLETELESMLLQPQRLLEDAARTRAFAMAHHEIQAVRSRLRKDFEELLET